MSTRLHKERRVWFALYRPLENGKSAFFMKLDYKEMIRSMIPYLISPLPSDFAGNHDGPQWSILCVPKVTNLTFSLTYLCLGDSLYDSALAVPDDIRSWLCSTTISSLSCLEISILWSTLRVDN
jgi:hypothetical protein